MSSPVLTDLEQKVTRARGAMASATELINGFSTRLQKAVEEALANGATAEELVPVQALADAVAADADALAQAVAANS